MFRPQWSGGRNPATTTEVITPEPGICRAADNLDAF
jgi:hypothetical protein